MASRFAEHPVGEPPGQAKLVSRQTHGPAGRIGRRSPALSGCFAKRSGGGSSELLGVRDAAPPDFRASSGAAGCRVGPRQGNVCYTEWAVEKWISRCADTAGPFVRRR